ncbi:translation initiation factor eIF3 subunit I [Martiniozyma asiatica (nom. inval.)]|nr:translation initiation factor eIF3 subunit I [Martiniozyma asiatica]
MLRPLMLKGHERPLTQLKFNREGDLIFSSAKDHHVSVWYSANGERLGTYEGHHGSIWSVDVDNTTNRLATAGADFEGKLWEAKDGKLLHTWVFEAPVKICEFSPDNSKLLFLTDHTMGKMGTIFVYEHDYTKSEQSATPILKIENEDDVSKRFVVASWSYGGKYIFTGHANGEISKFDAQTGNLVKNVRPFTEPVTDLQFSQDRSHFIASSRDKSSCIFDLEDLKVIKRYSSETPINSAVITPAKDFIIMGGGQDARSVTTTSMAEGMFDAMIYHKIFEDMIGRVKGHFGPINCLAIHPEGTCYASGGEDGYIRLHHFPKNYFDFYYDVEKTAMAESKQQQEGEVSEEITN